MSKYEEATRLPFIPHTEAGRLFSTVQRMKWDRDHSTPTLERDTHAISVESGKNSSQMSEEEAENFYLSLCSELSIKYPELYESIFR